MRGAQPGRADHHTQGKNMLIRTTRAACIAALLAISLLAATATTPAQQRVGTSGLCNAPLTTINLPNGDYFAATLPFEDRVALVIMDRVTRQVMGTFQMGRDTAVADFDWVSPDRVLISAAQKIGFLAEPQPTGDLYGMDASGGRVELLVGQSVGGNLGSRMQGKRAERVAAFLVDDLDDDRRAVTSGRSTRPYTRGSG